MSAIARSFKSLDKRLALLAVASGALLVFAAIGIPNLLRSHMSAYEATPASRERLHAMAEVENQALSDSAPVPMASVGQIAPARKIAETASSGATADRKLVRTGSLELTVKSPADA